MATPDTTTHAALLTRPGDVCRARAAEARAFAQASCGNDVPIWLEVAHAWDMAAAAHDAIDRHPAVIVGDPVMQALHARRRAAALASSALAVAA